MEKLAVIVPVYNEQEIISKVIMEWNMTLSALKINYSLHVFSDGSTDNTDNILRKVSSENNKVYFYQKTNTGHGPTILMGYKALMYKYDWLFQVDSDDEMSPKHFSLLWNSRHQYDFLIGERYNRNSNIVRKILSLGSRVCTKILFGNKVNDVNSPYRLLRSSFFKNSIAAIPEDTFAPNVIISGLASCKSCNVLKIKVPFSFRKTGSVSLKNFVILPVAMKCMIQTVHYKIAHNKKRKCQKSMSR